jgi:flavodoxin
MKELSIEEKARAYDEAKIKGSRLWECGKITRENYEYIFPELKESDEDRIKKKIIATIHLYYGEPLEEEAKEMLAWLEKQGEQKPINQCNMHEPTLDEARKWNEAYEKGYSLGYENTFYFSGILLHSLSWCNS